MGKKGYKQSLKKITELVAAPLAQPFDDIGKPEPLKYKLSTLWSRRINKEHRIVNEVLNDKLLIHSIKGHY